MPLFNRTMKKAAEISKNLTPKPKTPAAMKREQVKSPPRRPSRVL